MLINNLLSRNLSPFVFGSFSLYTILSESLDFGGNILHSSLLKVGDRS